MCWLCNPLAEGGSILPLFRRPDMNFGKIRVWMAISVFLGIGMLALAVVYLAECCDARQNLF